MKVYFVGDRKSNTLLDINEKIISYLEKLGHSVDKTHSAATFEDEIKHIETTYKRNTESIKKCDVVIAETSESYSGIGFLIAYALNEKKPVLALFNKNQGSNPSLTLKGSSANNKLVFSEYKDDSEIFTSINSFLLKSKNILDTKFILIISPAIDKYLQWVSDNRRMHKAQVVRLALEDVMDKDKEYKDYVKAN